MARFDNRQHRSHGRSLGSLRAMMMAGVALAALTGNAKAASCPFPLGNLDICFFADESAGNATIVRDGPLSVQFFQNSTAGNARITTNINLPLGGGSAVFHDVSSAGDSTIYNNSIVGFTGSSSAGNSDITNNETLSFRDQSSAENATITNNRNVDFFGFSTAGNARITNKINIPLRGGNLQFHDYSDAGSANITNDFVVNFLFQSSARNATIANNGSVHFFESSTAGNARITNTDGNHSGVTFHGSATAGNASIALAPHSFVYFENNSTAALAAITNNQGEVRFSGDSTAGSSTINNLGLVSFYGSSTAGNATITSEAGGVGFAENASGGEARLIVDNTAVADFSFLTSPGTTVGSLEGSGTFFLGSKTIRAGGNNLWTTIDGVIKDGGLNGGVGGAFVKEGNGALALTGINTYTGATEVDSGALIVGGSIASSSGLAVAPGAVIGGNGTLPSTIVNGIVSPGTVPGSIGGLSVNGNLAFNPNSIYLVDLSPSRADRTDVTGAARLNGTLVARFAAGSYVGRDYTLLRAKGGLGGTRFANLDADTPAGFKSRLSYTANDVILNLTADLVSQNTGLPANASGMATALDNYFNNGGVLPPNFVALYGQTGANLATALNTLSGEAATGAQQGGAKLSNLFLTLMMTPRSGGGVVVGGTGGRTAFAPETVAALPPDAAAAFAKIMKVQPREAESGGVLAYAPGLRAPVDGMPQRRWSIWAEGFGGVNRTKGDPAGTGTQDIAVRAGGFGAGVDYRLWPDTLVGFALAGSFSDWTLSNGLGGGKGDAFQAGVYAIHHWGPAYLSGALSFTQQWLKTNRTAFTGDPLTAEFDARNFGGRLEGGRRFATGIGGVTPYGAIQAQRIHTPGYAEADPNSSGFALAYGTSNADSARMELGARFDQAMILSDFALLILTSRAAWAHDHFGNATLAPSFQALPDSASFTVSGASLVPNLALLSGGAELRFVNGWSLGGRFDGEFARRAQSYAGTGTIRYAW